MKVNYDKIKIAPYGEYSCPPGQPGFVVVVESDFTNPKGRGPLYVWPQDWEGYPRMKGVFKTVEEAQSAVASLQ